MSSQDFDKEQGILSTTATISTPNSISVARQPQQQSQPQQFQWPQPPQSQWLNNLNNLNNLHGRNNFNNLNLNGRNTSIAIRVSIVAATSIIALSSIIASNWSRRNRRNVKKERIENITSKASDHLAINQSPILSTTPMESSPASFPYCSPRLENAQTRTPKVARIKIVVVGANFRNLPLEVLAIFRQWLTCVSNELPEEMKKALRNVVGLYV
ncbi:hypothetical protein RIR_jg26914.t1 [Rhizophagus irregularis DAOM 181602=DAOM 197198]|nr:hypothetical protein RIR_jg26914.t1 [Rhizophagus irregularis DAOM 181602=DAOM 197198]